MMLFLLLLACLAFLTECASALPTWPSSVDELEDIMYLIAGYRSRNFASAVTPCSFSAQGNGRIAAAEWIRTAFHDMGTTNIYSAPANVGGLDASIMFETARSENIGASFQTHMQFLAPYFNSRVSAADLIALSVYTATRSCAGPVVPIRGGRIDAIKAGALGVPEPQNPTLTFINQFDRMGFNTSDMIAMTACGHTLGGVHAEDFPLIVPANTPAPNGFVLFDDTTIFDNKVVTDYIIGNTTNPLVVGISTTNTRNSDGRVYNSDGNVTMRALANPATFQTSCASIFQRMIDTVPPAVVLTDPVLPYEIKPVALQLTLLSGGSQISFTGEIRVRTTVRKGTDISTVQLIYKDRTGNACSGCTITTATVGSGSGFDDSFSFYSFSSNLASASSISSFTVVVTLTSGTTETYDNNGAGFPIQDVVIFQSPQSCLTPTIDANGNKTLTVLAAVRNTVTNAVNLDLSLLVPRAAPVAIPALQTSSLAMTLKSSVGLYNLFSITYTIDPTLAPTARFDVSTGAGTSKIADVFKSAASLGAICTTLPSGSTSSSTVSVPSSTSSKTTSRVSTSSSSSSIVPSTTSKSSSSSVLSTTTSKSSSSSIVSSTTSSKTTSKTSSSTSSSATGWNYLGCYTDIRTGRSLPVPVQVAGGGQAMTNDLCQSTCKAAGYILAGTEYSGECYCGNSLQNGGGPAPDGAAQCTMTCNGNTAQICGGPDRLSLYAFGTLSASSAV